MNSPLESRDWDGLVLLMRKIVNVVINRLVQQV